MLSFRTSSFILTAPEWTTLQHAACKDDVVVAEEIVLLGDVNVFKAELIVIQYALLWLKSNNKKCKSCWIKSDSQSGISAIFAHYIIGKLVLEIGNLMAELREQGYQISKSKISLIRGHVNHTANEYVNCLAKRGWRCTGGRAPCPPTSPSPTKLSSAELGRQLISNGTKSGVVTHSVPKQKEFLPTVDRSRQKLIKELSRSSLALLTQIVTGHLYFRAHMWYMYPEDIDNIDCQICGNEPETPLAYLQLPADILPALQGIRQDRI